MAGVWSSKGMERSVAALCEATAARGVRVGDVVDREGCGVVHLAAKEGLDGVVSVLLGYAERLGIDMNMRDKQGFTALVSRQGRLPQRGVKVAPRGARPRQCRPTLRREYGGTKE